MLLNIQTLYSSASNAPVHVHAGFSQRVSCLLAAVLCILFSLAVFINGEAQSLLGQKAVSSRHGRESERCFRSAP